MMRRLFILDAYALIFRAYYGFINKPLVNSKGQVTSAIYGFTKTLQEILAGVRMPDVDAALLDEDGLLRPDCIVVCFDPKGGTFRHKEFPTYKAQREQTPEDITTAVPWIKRILEAYRIPILEVTDYEADDVAGTLARLADDSGAYETLLVSPDKDYAQLVTTHTRIFKPKSFGPGYEVLDVQAVLDKYGLKRTQQVIDMLGLQGDSADNIPGCPGVGPKTAQKLIADFDSIEAMLEAVQQAAAEGKKEMPQLKKAMMAKVLDNAQQIRDSKYLATICREVPGVTLDDELLTRKEPDVQTLAELYDELEFRQMRAVALKATGQPAASQPSARHKAAAGVPTGDAAASATAEGEAPAPASLATIRDVETHYTVADTPEKRQEMIAELFWNPAWAFDTETTSLSVIDAELVGISFAIGGHKAWYVPVPAEQDAARAVVDELRTLFEAEGTVKIAQNAKYDYSVLKRYGVEVAYPLFDTMIAHYLLEPELPHNMDYLAEVMLRYRPIPTSDLIETKKGAARSTTTQTAAQEASLADLFSDPSLAGDAAEAVVAKPATMRECPVAQVAEYCCEDSDVTYQLAAKLRPMLQEQGLEPLFMQVEMPLVRVLADMELTGVRLDVKALTESRVILQAELLRLEKRLAEIAGHDFNPLSPKAVAQVIFDEMKLVPNAKARSTAEEVLQQLKNRLDKPEHLELIDGILTYRGIKKLLGTYIDALPHEVSPRTGRIHCQFNQTVTATGRLSSSNPNLQNIPIRDEMGRELRKAFVPDEGEVFFSADYSQVELRLMAHLSQDENMVSAFLEGDDIHRATAAKIYHLPIDQVDKLQRTKAKTANFGIIYGISSFGLATRLNISRQEAKELIDGYFATYPGVKAYMDQSIATAREKGYVETLMGRRRMLKDIHSANATVRGYAERNAINAPIQGTAADIIKLAMIRITERIRKEQLHAKLLIQVHDELNFTVPEAEVDRLEQLVLEEMAGVMDLSVPLVADCGRGANWLAAH